MTFANNRHATVNAMSSQADPLAVRQLWGLAETPGRGPRARFDVHEIARAAVAMADRSGTSDVTLAAVAGSLGLATTALYRYVDSKETLVELMIDAALGEAPAVGSVTGWVDALWACYQEHSWLAQVPLTRAPRCPNAIDWMSGLVAALASDGHVDPVATALTLDVLVRGYAVLDVVASSEEPPSPEIMAEIARRHPVLAEGPSRPGSVRSMLDVAVRAVLTSTPPADART